MENRMRDIPIFGDIRGDITFIGLSLKELIIQIGVFFLFIVVFFLLKIGFNVNPTVVFICLAVIFIIVYLTLVFKLKDFAEYFFQYQKDKNKTTLNTLMSFKELGSINTNTDGNEVVFLENKIKPFETLPGSLRDRKANEWANSVYASIKKDTYVTTYITTSKEDKQALERRHKMAIKKNDEIELNRIDYHYAISQHATSTHYLSKVEKLSYSDYEIDEVINLDGEIVDGSLVTEKAKQQLLPNFKKKRGNELKVSLDKLPVFNNEVKVGLSAVEVDDHKIKSYLITDFPTMAHVNMLYDFTHNSDFIGVNRDESRTDINITLFVKKSDIKFGSKQNRQLDRLQNSIKEKSSTGYASEQADEYEIATFEALRQMKNSKGNFVEVSMLVTISTNKNNFKKKSRELEDFLKTKGFSFNKLFLRQYQGLSAAWYLGDGSILENNKGRIMMLSTLSAFYPFMDGTISNSYGSYEGHRLSNNTIVHTSHEGSDNENTVCTGPSGDGKSYKMKSKSKSFQSQGHKGYIYDVDKEYRTHCDEVGGTYIDLTGKDSVYVDPTIIEKPLKNELVVFNLSEDDIRKVNEHDAARYETAVNNTIDTLQLLCTRFDDEAEMENAAEKVLADMYNAAGIHEDKPETWNLNPDQISIHILYDLICQECTKNDSEYLKGALMLKKRLRTYFKGRNKNMLKNAVDSSWLKDSPLTVFSVSTGTTSEAEYKKAALRINMISPIVYGQIVRDRFKKNIESYTMYDEYQRLRNLEAANKCVYRDITTGRKFHLKVIIGFNDPSFLFPKFEGIWTNAKYKWLFGVDAKAIDSIATNTDMPESVLEHWRNLPKYGFIYCKREDNVDYYDVLKVRLPKSEEALYETRNIVSKAS